MKIIKVLWLVPARKGSKSVHNKNIKILGGNPLISYRIRSAHNTSVSNDVWVSTDCHEYAEISKKFGAQIPFIRPPHLASDEATSVDVILHAMDFAEKAKLFYDYIGLLEPTSPFILSQQLDDAINILEKNDEAIAIVATRENRPNSAFIQKDATFLSEIALNLSNLKKINRQSFYKEITPSGGFYIGKWNDFLKHKTFYTDKTLSYNVNEIHGLEIDEPLDWEFAEFLIKKGLINLNQIYI